MPYATLRFDRSTWLVADFRRHALGPASRATATTSARRVSVRRVLSQIHYRYRLYDDAMGAVAEGVTDRHSIWRPSIRADFRRARTRPRRSWTNSSVSCAVTLAGAVGNDGARLCRGQRDVGVSVADRERIPRFGARAFAFSRRMPIARRVQAGRHGCRPCGDREARHSRGRRERPGA